jgi:hypothetical protein
LRAESRTKRGADGVRSVRETGRPKPRFRDKSGIQDFGSATAKERVMTETVVKLQLNQQQLELIDRTIAQGVAPDRVSLVRLALREYAAARKAEAEPAQ